jgi:hypothetical protein
MVCCAVAAVLLVAGGAFSELLDMWKHPDLRNTDDGLRQDLHGHTHHDDHRR